MGVNAVAVATHAKYTAIVLLICALRSILRRPPPCTFPQGGKPRISRQEPVRRERVMSFSSPLSVACACAALVSGVWTAANAPLCALTRTEPGRVCCGVERDMWPLRLRGGMVREDHLPRSFKRALERHKKARLLEEKRKRLAKRLLRKGLPENRVLAPPGSGCLTMPVEGDALDPPVDSEGFGLETRMPWWMEPLEEDPPDWTIFDKNWADRPDSERPVLADGTRAGPFWDSLDPRLKRVDKYHERLWLEAGVFSLESQVLLRSLPHQVSPFLRSVSISLFGFFSLGR